MRRDIQHRCQHWRRIREFLNFSIFRNPNFHVHSRYVKKSRIFQKFCSKHFWYVRQKLKQIVNFETRKSNDNRKGVFASIFIEFRIFKNCQISSKFWIVQNEFLANKNIQNSGFEADFRNVQFRRLKIML